MTKINSFGTISPWCGARLVASLNRRGDGRIDYRDFQSQISGFLAASCDSHSSSSSDELNAILTRTQVLSTFGLPVQAMPPSHALQDTREDVRASGRHCFWAFRSACEERGQRLHARLDSSKQKLLDSDRPPPDSNGVNLRADFDSVAPCRAGEATAPER